MPTLDDLRTASEAKLEKLLARMDRRHKAMLRAAIEQYGRVQDIPQSVWDEIRADMENEEVAAAVLLAIIIGDEWTTDELKRQQVQGRNFTRRQLQSYALTAARQTQEVAAQTVDTLKQRLGRKIEDSKTVGPGGVGELTSQGIDDTLEDVFSDERRGTIATDHTTRGLSAGQLGASARAGGDGAQTTAGQRVQIQMVWVTERDYKVCPRCSPLHDQPEAVWGQVFPNGPGPDAHPNCRCSLRPVVVVVANQEAA